MNASRQIAWLGWILILLLVGCGPVVQKTETAVNTTPTTSEFSAFISLVENANCAEDRNQLYRIDNEYFFHTTEGWCLDAGYDHTLYGSSVQEKLCSLEDSFVGPLSSCEPEFEVIFEIMLQNLDQPDLGLGESHSVELVFEKDE